MSNNTHHTAKGFIEILNLCYFMNNTSTRTPESFKLIYDTVVQSINENSSTKLTPLSGSEINSSLKLDFSLKISTSITKEYLAGMEPLQEGRSGGFNFTTSSYRVTSFFQVTQSSDDYSVLVALGVEKLRNIQIKKLVYIEFIAIEIF